MPASFDYRQPYSSRRSPVMAKNVVATSQPLAAQAGLRMLLDGGNAVDAALAAAIALTVVEPPSNGLGSDTFCLLWDGQGLAGLNGSGRSPEPTCPSWTGRPFHSRRRDTNTRQREAALAVPRGRAGVIGIPFVPVRTATDAVPTLSVMAAGPPLAGVP